MRFGPALAAWISSLVLALPLAAHPHVWIEARAEVSVAAGYVEGLWAEWTFDDVFGQLVLADHDLDFDGKLEANEIPGLKKGYFDNLKDYDYFSHLMLGGKDLKVPVPQKFTASVNAQGRLVYRFFLPLGVRVDPKTPLGFAFYDASFYADLIFTKDNPVRLTATDGGKASFVLRPEKAKTYYGGQVTPTFAVLTWSPS